MTRESSDAGVVSVARSSMPMPSPMRAEALRREEEEFHGMTSDSDDGDFNMRHAAVI